MLQELTIDQDKLAHEMNERLAVTMQANML